MSITYDRVGSGGAFGYVQRLKLSGCNAIGPVPGRVMGDWSQMDTLSSFLSVVVLQWRRCGAGLDSLLDWQRPCASRSMDRSILSLRSVYPISAVGLSNLHGWSCFTQDGRYKA